MNNEDIKVLEEFIEEIEEILERIDDYTNLDTYAFPIDYKQTKALKNLIKEYKELEETNSKYENGKIFSNKQIKIVEEGIRIGAETAINKEIENFISKRKLQELLKNAEEKYQTYKKGVDENENLKFGMWRYLGQVQILKDLLGISRNIVTLDSEELLQEGDTNATKM